MLILARKQHEAIVIDDNIIVEIIDIKGGIVRLGITAPIEIEVHRNEVYDRIQVEKDQVV